MLVRYRRYIPFMAIRYPNWNNWAKYHRNVFENTIFFVATSSFVILRHVYQPAPVCLLSRASRTVYTILIRMWGSILGDADVLRSRKSGEECRITATTLTIAGKPPFSDIRRLGFYGEANSISWGRPDSEVPRLRQLSVPRPNHRLGRTPQ